jgi:fructosamine-3-kinase
MKTWQVIAIHENNWKKDINDFYSTKKIALSVARQINRERGDEFDSISIIADDGNQLLDETEVIIK